MYVRTIIEPEWDEGFRWHDAPQLPSRIVPGLGLVDEQGHAVEVFRGVSEAECWSRAFAASESWDFEEFQARLIAAGCVPYVWLAVCPGRDQPARWFMLMVARDLLA